MIYFYDVFFILLFYNCGMLSSKHSSYCHLNQEAAVTAHNRHLRLWFLAFLLKEWKYQILPWDLSRSWCTCCHLYMILPNCTWPPVLRKCWSKYDCEKLPEEWTPSMLCRYGNIVIIAAGYFSVLFLRSSYPDSCK